MVAGGLYRLSRTGAKFSPRFLIGSCVKNDVEIHEDGYGLTETQLHVFRGHNLKRLLA